MAPQGLVLLDSLSADFRISESSGQIVAIIGGAKPRNLTTSEIFSALLSLQDLANDDIREFKQVLHEKDEEVKRLERRIKELEK